jgi:hypothetical protein
MARRRRVDICSVTFFPALILFAAGAIKFMKSNHVAVAKAKLLS